MIIILSILGFFILFGAFAYLAHRLGWDVDSEDPGSEFRKYVQQQTTLRERKKNVAIRLKEYRAYLQNNPNLSEDRRQYYLNEIKSLESDYGDYNLQGVLLQNKISDARMRMYDEENKRTKIALVLFSPILLAILGAILYGIGWVWYYLCCGFLLFKDIGFFGVIFFGVLSILFLVAILGLVAICFGWDPFKK